MKKSTKSLLISLGVLVIIFIAGSLAYIHSKQPNRISNDHMPSKDFLSYDVPGFGVKIAYPQGWSQEISEYYTGAPNSIIFASPASSSQKATTVQFDFVKVGPGTDWIKSASFTDNCGNLSAAVSRVLTVIGGKRALVQKDSGTSDSSRCARNPFESDGYYSEAVMLPYARDSRYVFIDFTTPVEQKEVTENTLDSMIGDLVVPDEIPTDWQMYASKAYGTSFLYPPETTLLESVKNNNVSLVWGGYNGQFNTIRLVRLPQEKGSNFQSWFKNTYGLDSRKLATGTTSDGYERVTTAVTDMDCPTSVSAVSDGKVAAIFSFQCIESPDNTMMQMINSVKFGIQ